MRIQDHKRDANSVIYKHSVNCVHPVSDSSFCVLGSGYGSTQRRRLAESLFIKDFSPDLNTQGQSVPLKLLS